MMSLAAFQTSQYRVTRNSVFDCTINRCSLNVRNVTQSTVIDGQESVKLGKTYKSCTSGKTTTAVVIKM